MARPKKSTISNPKPRKRPATSPEAREQQLVSLAYDLVEQRLLDGTATSQETTHFLKIGSIKAQYELEKLRNENELLKAKTEALESAKRIDELYENAIAAMRTYSGSSSSDIPNQ